MISWPLLKKTNDVSNATSLCRLAFQPSSGKVGVSFSLNGGELELQRQPLLFCVLQFLAVPVETKVHLYERGSWEHAATLSDDLLTQVRNATDD